MAESPTPSRKKNQEPTLIDFPSALRLVLDGKKVSKKDWGSTEEYFYLKEEWLILHTGGEEHTYQIRDVDLKGKDYFVIQ